MDTTCARKRILLVDDEAEVRSATKMLLEFHGYDVDEADNGVKGLALFQKDGFDLVITDFRMEKMNGGELAQKIKKLSPSTPVIMITGYHDEVPSGVVDVLVDKPFSWDHLRNSIAGLIGPQRSPGQEG